MLLFNRQFDQRLRVMIGPLLPRPTIAALGLLLLLGRTASAQTPVVPTSSSVADLDRDIAEYEDTLKKIRDEKWIYIPGPGGGVLLDRNQEAGLFSHLIFLGQMSPDSVASMHRMLRVSTNILQAAIESELSNLYQKRAARAAPPPVAATPAPTAPDRVAGAITGQWSVRCLVSDVDSGDAGNFTLRFAGNGGVSGDYTSGSGGFTVDGSVDSKGKAGGSGSHPDGAFSWTAEITVIGSRLVMNSGAVHFSPNHRGTTCAPGGLAQTN